jgi:hypothetical protein
LVGFLRIDLVIGVPWVALAEIILFLEMLKISKVLFSEKKKL